MANSVLTLVINTQDSAQAVKDHLVLSRQSPALLLSALARYLERMTSGVTACKVYVMPNVTQASGTITLSSFVNADTVTINGTTLTGATSTQDTTNFKIGADDTATGANMVTTILANPTLQKQVTASAAAGVVTVTALGAGLFGNLGTLAISAHGSVSGGGLLASGAQDAPTIISHGI